MKIKMIGVERITPSPHQPRERFDEGKLGDLADSIAEHGLLQPVIVRPMEKNTYQIIAGERRWRAVQMTDMEKIPAFVKGVDDAEQMAESLIENVHREDLGPIEKGWAVYQLFLLNDVDMEPKKLAKKIQVMDNRRQDKRKIAVTAIEGKILGACENQIHKALRTIREWLETISVSKTIQRIEAKETPENRIGGYTLARLSTIDSKKEQVSAYRKIRRDDMDGKEASRFIAWARRQTPKVREEVYQSDVRVDVESPDMGFGEVAPVTIPEDEAKEVKTKFERIKEKTEETLAKPEVRRKGRLRRNWQALSSILDQLGDVFCPNCGLNKKGEPVSGWEKLRFECHDLNLRDARKTARENYQKAVGGEKKND